MAILIVWLIIAVGVVLLLRALIRSFIEGWHPLGFFGNAALAILRAFPFVLCFTPYLLMKRGLGVLIPASLYLFGATYSRLFGHATPDAEDNHNLGQAAAIFFVAW